MRALYLFTTLLMLLIAAGCKKSNDAPTIVATWQLRNSYTADHNLVRQLSFNDHGEFTMKTVVTNKSTAQLLGFTAKGSGQYTTAGDQLTFTYQQIYNKTDNQQEYVSEDKLTSSGTTPQTSVSKFSFSAKKDTLILVTNACPPNALCFVGPITEKYVRVSLNATY